MWLNIPAAVFTQKACGEMLILMPYFATYYRHDCPQGKKPSVFK